MDPLGNRPDFRKKLKYNKLKVADIYSIAGMKACVTLTRSKFRDYYDLFCLAHDHCSLSDIISSALSFRPHFNSRIILQNISSLSETQDESLLLLKPIYKVSRKEIEAFFRELISLRGQKIKLKSMDKLFSPETLKKNIDFHSRQQKIAFR